ncbi:hypothetical protein IQ232_01265 [Microcystis aeruginosa LEGE 11464]|uniref:hypothetical protein n=2 Tax=Microcystis aeruginosa TaxID=1126 RepID=UPI001881C8A4|nr:hypothetical protein [Microcystis aeruginosa]MBE9088454.1 hypothetical protein [Microcystis aeruginosa LEGE 11464]
MDSYNVAPKLSGIFAIQQTDNCPHVFAIGTDNTLYLNWRDSSGGWSGWGANWNNAPKLANIFAIETTDNCPHVFAIGTDNTLYLNWRDSSGGWSGWGANWNNAPKLANIFAIETTDNCPHVFAIGTDNTLYLNWRDSSGGWSGWGANWNNAPKLASIFAIETTDNCPHVFGIGTDNTLYLNWRDSSGQWSGWIANWGAGKKPSPVTNEYIDRVKEEVKDYFNHLSGEAYLRVLDTPHVWGMPFGKAIMPQALTRQAEFERAIVEIVQKAKYRCDISSLNSPDPDWARVIMGAMDTALTRVMGRKQPTQFRFFFGQTPTVPIGEPTNYADFKAALIRLFRERSQYWEMMPEIWFGRFYRLQSGIISAIQAKVFGSAVIGSDDTKMTWNHTKIISVDGTEALVGGHNLNMDLFRSYPPVHDVSNVVHGEAAYGAQLFLNQMWVCGTDLFTKESLNTDNLTWVNRDSEANKPNDPLVQPDIAAYMKTRQDALIAMHESGVQTGVDAPYNNGEQPVPAEIRDQDLQTVSDLDLEVFQYRVIYNTYEGWSDYKQATRMLTLGKYWDGPEQTTDFQKASEIMKEYLIKNAKRTIKMSQMDIVSAWKKNWSDHHVCIWLLEALLANPNLQVQIVVSPLDAGAGAEGDQYSFGSGASRTFDLLKYYMTHDVATDAPLNDPDGKRASALTRLHVAPFYFTDQVPASDTIEGDTYKWPNLSKEGYTATLKQKPLADQPPSHGVIGSAAWSVLNASGYIYDKVPSAPGNHAKIMIVDDELYIVGSDNLYPGFLSEIDYMVEGADAVNELITSYWNPLWQYSGPHAISGASDTASVTVGYIQGGNTKTVIWTLNLSMSLLELKQKMKNELPADGHADNAADLNVWGPNGMAMTPDTQILRDFGLKNGQRINVDFPGAGTAFG